MIRPLGGKTPQIAESAFISEAAYIMGEVIIGENCAVFPGAVIRADFGPIRMGKQVLVEDNVVLHCAPPGLEIGDDVTFGHGAAVNSRKIGSKVLVGMNATLLHGVEIGDRCIIAAGTVVSQGMKVPDGSFVVGVPGKIASKATEKQLQWVEREPELFNWMMNLYRGKGF
ncbi:MAG: gamma carbonic anhydrase family protein [Chloroflexi bacterium]|nr:gamma carbonic anhydrase family protein [Chloroflexota bacterium]